ncbi:MAG: hypothetical protein EBT22_13190 [Chloroflexi bacterium]|nr:hypothetical protein [Chloroflexota bacterium]
MLVRIGIGVIEMCLDIVIRTRHLAATQSNRQYSIGPPFGAQRAGDTGLADLDEHLFGPGRTSIGVPRHKWQE